MLSSGSVGQDCTGAAEAATGHDLAALDQAVSVGPVVECGAMDGTHVIPHQQVSVPPLSGPPRVRMLKTPLGLLAEQVVARGVAVTDRQFIDAEIID